MRVMKYSTFVWVASIVAMKVTSWWGLWLLRQERFAELAEIVIAVNLIFFAVEIIGLAVLPLGWFVVIVARIVASVKTPRSQRRFVPTRRWTERTEEIRPMEDARLR